MTALVQFSYTSTKKLRTASSVAALVGFAPIDVELTRSGVVVPPGVEVVVEEEEVGMDGWWRSRNLVLEGVRKREM